MLNPPQKGNIARLQPHQNVVVNEPRLGIEDIGKCIYALNDECLVLTSKEHADNFTLEGAGSESKQRILAFFAQEPGISETYLTGRYFRWTPCASSTDKKPDLAPAIRGKRAVFRGKPGRIIAEGALGVRSGTFCADASSNEFYSATDMIHVPTKNIATEYCHKENLSQTEKLFCNLTQYDINRGDLQILDSFLPDKVGYGTKALVNFRGIQSKATILTEKKSGNLKEYLIAFDENSSKAALSSHAFCRPESTKVIDRFCVENRVSLSERRFAWVNESHVRILSQTEGEVSKMATAPTFKPRDQVKVHGYSVPGRVVCDDPGISVYVGVAFDQESTSFQFPENWSGTTKQMMNDYLDKFGSNSKRRVFLFVPRENVQLVPEENKERKEKTMPDKSDKPSFMDMLKNDGKQAGVRIASTQMRNAVRTAIVTVMKNKGADNLQVQAVAAFLETEFGAGLISGLLGFALPHLPKYGDDPRVKMISEELRIGSMATVGNEVADIAMSYLMPAVLDALKALPATSEEDAKVRVEHTNTTETTTETPNQAEEQHETEETEKKTAVA